MFIKLFDKFVLFFSISSKKFHANTNIAEFLSFTFSLETMGIFTPGINFPCFNGLSSTIKSISFLILK